MKKGLKYGCFGILGIGSLANISMVFKRNIILTALVILIPISSFAQGMQQGIERFLFVSFGIVAPSMVLLTLFYFIISRKTTKLALFIHILSAYLGVICIRYLIRYIYLYDRRSSITRIDGSLPDMSNEITLILGCSIGIVVITTIVFITLKKSKKNEA